MKRSKFLLGSSAAALLGLGGCASVPPSQIVDGNEIRPLQHVGGRLVTVDMHYEFGKQALANGQVRAAMAQFRAALRQDPQHVDSINGLAVAYSLSGRDDVAAGLLRSALARDPDSVMLMGNLSRALMRAGRLEDARAVLDRALRMPEQEAGGRASLEALDREMSGTALASGAVPPHPAVETAALTAAQPAGRSENAPAAAQVSPARVAIPAVVPAAPAQVVLPAATPSIDVVALPVASTVTAQAVVPAAPVVAAPVVAAPVVAAPVVESSPAPLRVVTTLSEARHVPASVAQARPSTAAPAAAATPVVDTRSQITTPAQSKPVPEVRVAAAEPVSGPARPATASAIAQEPVAAVTQTAVASVTAKPAVAVAPAALAVAAPVQPAPIAPAAAPVQPAAIAPAAAPAQPAVVPVAARPAAQPDYLIVSAEDSTDQLVRVGPALYELRDRMTAQVKPQPPIVVEVFKSPATATTATTPATPATRSAAAAAVPASAYAPRARAPISAPPPSAPVAKSAGASARNESTVGRAPAAEPTPMARGPLAHRVEVRYATVEVSNGAGVNGLAARWSGALREKGADVVRVTNYQNFSQTQTTIYYRRGFSADARHLADQLAALNPRIVASDALRAGVDIQLVLGRNANKPLIVLNDTDAMSLRADAWQLRDGFSG